MAIILLCVHQFFPRFFTGTEALTLTVAEELNRRGHQIVIFTVEPYLPGDDIPEFIEEGWREVKNRSRPLLRKDIYEDLTVWRLFVPEPANALERLARESNECHLTDFYEKIIHQERPDVVHIFHLMRLTGTFVEIVKKHHIPIFFTATDFWLLCPIYQLIRHDDQLCTQPDPIQCFRCMIGVNLRKSE